jgi:uncharacterized iron-regulated membrane protein
MEAKAALYRTVWRWHFYAALFVVPMVLILALTGAAYLFKPQVDRWEESAWRGLDSAGEVAPTIQRDAALAAVPGSSFHSYRLPEQSGDAAMVHLALPGGAGMRDVFVSPQGKVLGALDPDKRLMEVVQTIHGQLLLGPRGSWLVELAASWAFVMLASGLYLWWPQGRRLAGVLYPRLRSGRSVMWRDLHAVTGFWVTGLALVLLLTGLQWADVWGGAFKAVRAEMGWVKGAQDWTLGGRTPADVGDHAEHDHAEMSAAMPAGMHHMAGLTQGQMPPVSLDAIAAIAKSERLGFPVLISPPGAKSPDWAVKSDTQNRPQRVTLRYDAITGRQTGRETFADKHPIDQVVGYGIAWHEGALFGWVNQLIGLLTVLMLVLMTVSGFVMWRRRKPEGMLGAPPLPAMPARIRGAALIVLALALFLPMLALSLAAIVLIERLVLARIAPVAQWLGLAKAAQAG